jgi:hypothetical protein
MTHREINETINVTESKHSERVPVKVSGEIEVSETDIARDADGTAEDVHKLTNELEDAIEGVFEDYDDE